MAELSAAIKAVEVEASVKITINDESNEQDDGDETSQHINPLFNDYYDTHLEETKLLVVSAASPLKQVIT